MALRKKRTAVVIRDLPRFRSLAAQGSPAHNQPDKETERPLKPFSQRRVNVLAQQSVRTWRKRNTWGVIG